LTLAGVTFLLAGCGGGGLVSRQLGELDTLIYTDPGNVLRQLDSLETATAMSRRDRMHLELLRGAAMNKADSLFTTDSVMLRVVEYYDRHGSANERMQAYYTLGCAYRDLGDAPRAIECYQEAVHCADTLSQDCDFPTLMRVHSQMSLIYRKQKLTDYQQSEIQICTDLSWKIQDTLSALLFEDAFCSILYDKKQYDECIQKTNAIRDKFIKCGFQNYAALACIHCVKSYLNLKNFDKANEYLIEYEKCRFLTEDKHKITGGTSSYYICKGNYYLGTGKADSAIICYRNSMQDMDLFNNQPAAYNGMLNAFVEKNQCDSVKKYKELLLSASNSMNESMLSEACIQVKNLYDYSVERDIAKRNEQEVLKTKNERLLFLIMFATCAATLVIFYLWHWGVKNKKEKELNAVQLHLQRTMEQYREMEGRLQYYMDEKENLDNLLSQTSEEITQHQEEKDRIEIKLKETNQQMERLAEEVQKQQIIILHQKGEIMSLNRVFETTDIYAKNAVLYDSDIVHRFRDSLYRSQVKLLKSDWNELDTLIRTHYPFFNSKIASVVKLQSQEYRICLLVKAGFEPYEIDCLLEKSHSYASQVRKRLHTKVFGINGTAAEFDKKIRLME